MAFGCTQGKGGGKSSSALGFMCLVGSLVCDGITGGAQDSLKEKARKKGLKAKRDQLRWEPKVKKKQKASDSEIERLQQEVAHAETDYASTGRSGKRACVAAVAQ